MLKNYLRVALRNIKKNRVYSFINIAGLAVGIASCIVIMLYVGNELSYDKYNRNADNIYRIVLHALINGHELDQAVSAAPLGPALQRDLPSVVTYTRVWKGGFPVIRYREKAFSEQRFFWADSTFFDVFTVNFVEGNPKTALTQPNSVVITQSTARKYFGNENPVGKILNLDKRSNYIVTGVIRDIPQDSHLHFDFLGSLCTIADSRDPNWLSNNYYTYVLLREGTDPRGFQKELDAEVVKYVGPQVRALLGLSLEQFTAAGNRYGYFLQPLTSIHLHSHLNYEAEPNGDISYVYVFSAIAIAILLIACVNFVNLSTARSEKRAREVGIRKTLGSNRSRLVRQFIVESIVMSGIAVLLAVVISELLLPLFNNVYGHQITLDFFDDAYAIPVLALLAVVVGILAGAYPAFYLSSFRPIDVLKSELKPGGRRALLRSGLVIFQFVVSIVLFVGTLVIYNQLGYIENKNLGFDKQQVIVVNRVDDLFGQLQSFEDELKGNPGIISMTNSNSIPGSQSGDQAYMVEGTSAQQIEDLRAMWCDYSFDNTYKIPIVSGRFFSKEHPSDTAAVVVNEAAAKTFGVKDLVGKVLETFDGRGKAYLFPVVGMMKDFNYQSLHQPIRPLVIRLFPSGSSGKFLSVRVAGGNVQGTLSFIENKWKDYAGNEGFSYNFLDQDLNEQYLAEQRTNNITAIFACLAIFVASLGLLGLAAFVTEQRTKEIGVRKVLGASIPEIIILLSKEFVKWVLIANAIAWPIAYYVMEKWLENFVYRTDIGLGIFAISGMLALLIALLTVSSHAIRAAKANPIESLRYE